MKISSTVAQLHYGAECNNVATANVRDTVRTPVFEFYKGKPNDLNNSNEDESLIVFFMVSRIHFDGFSWFKTQGWILIYFLTDGKVCSNFLSANNRIAKNVIILKLATKTFALVWSLSKVFLLKNLIVKSLQKIWSENI